MVDEEALVIGRVGANCGNVHLSEPESWITDNAIYSKFKSPFVDHRFMVLQLRNKQLNRLAGGSGQPYLSQKKLNSVAVALPPLAEQKQIVDEVERLLSVADNAADTASREETRAERLRQSILKQAFSGRLVPHDKNATPPSIDGTASERSDPDASDGADSDVEDLLGSADPDKQIEMDL
jgi:type I restriction enzyme S subunit